MKVGSHLYGTATPTSDLDIKGIYLPCARDILLQRVQPSVSEKRLKAHGQKNTANDIDYELYSPTKYLSLLAQGQSIALEMLFAPDTVLLTPPHPAWGVIKALAPKILTKQAASFVRYCQQQANKYCVKGARVAAVRRALEALTSLELRYGSYAKLHSGLDVLQQLAENNEFLSIGSTVLSSGKQALYFEMCGKRALFDASIGSACSIAKKILDEYGQRALAAEDNQGADWKALSHAVRIGHQAIEFLQHRHITFPRPEAEHLRAIKQGKVGFEQVAQEIEQLLQAVQVAESESTLPEHFDQEIIDNFIEQLHMEQIVHKGSL